MILTLLGIENYLNSQTPSDSLFSSVSLPDTFTDVDDASTLFDNILLESAEFEVLYPEPETLKKAIETWFEKWYNTISKWSVALQIDYNPVENYEKTATWEDSNTGSQSSASNTNSENDTTGSGNDTDSVWAYNSESAQNYNKTDSTDGSHSVGAISAASNLNTESAGDGSRSESGFIPHQGQASRQDLLERELEVRRFNLIQQITDAFLTDMCVMVY